MINNDIQHYISLLTQKTQDGTLTWSRHSRTTFSLSKSAGNMPLRVNFQTRRAPLMKYKGFVFNIQIEEGGRILLSIDSSEHEELHAPLQNLFDAIESSLMAKGLEAFKRILDE